MMVKRKAQEEPEIEMNWAEHVPEMTIDETIAFINKKANDEKKVKRSVIKRADQAGNPFLIRRPFHIAGIDTCIGGGIPAGGITQIDGPAGAGKNALVDCAIAAVQENYGDDACVGWCCLETPYDKQHARINSVIVPDSPEELYLENERRKVEGRDPLSEEEVEFRTRTKGTFLMIDEGTTEQRLQAVLDLVEQNVCQLIGVDSVSAAVAKARVDTPLGEDPQQSANALMLSEFMRLCWGKAYATPMNLTSLVIISQLRANRNRMNAFSPEGKPGGIYALRHGKLLDLALKEGMDIPAKGWPKTGKVVKWEVTKAKAGSHEGYQGEINYDFEHGFDRYTDLYITAKNLGVIIQGSKKGKVQLWDFVDSHGEVFVNGATAGEKGENLVSVLYNDYEVFRRTYMETLKKAGVSCLHRR